MVITELTIYECVENCIRRESNPGHFFGREEYYHYNTNAHVDLCKWCERIRHSCRRDKSSILNAVRFANVTLTYPLRLPFRFAHLSASLTYPLRSSMPNKRSRLSRHMKHTNISILRLLRIGHRIRFYPLYFPKDSLCSPVLRFLIDCTSCILQQIRRAIRKPGGGMSRRSFSSLEGRHGGQIIPVDRVPRIRSRCRNRRRIHEVLVSQRHLSDRRSHGTTLPLFRSPKRRVKRSS